VYVPNAFISGLFYEAVNGSDYTELIGWLMDDELERMWKEKVAA
jgi:hypothetical protein